MIMQKHNAYRYSAQLGVAPVAHRQYAFSVPRPLRQKFARPRVRLDEPCRIAASLLDEACHATVPRARPAFIEFVPTFGNLVKNVHLHVHVLAGDDRDSHAATHVLHAIQSLRSGVSEVRWVRT